MKKAFVAFGIAVGLVGLGAAAVPLAENFAANRLQAGLKREGIQVETVEIGFFDRRIYLRNVVGGRNGELRIDEWESAGIAWPLAEILRGRLPLGGLRWSDPLHVARLHLRNLRVVEPDEGGAWTIGELRAAGLDLPRYDAAYAGPHRNQVMVARLLRALSVGRLEETDVTYRSFDETTYAVRRLEIEGYSQGAIQSLAVADIDIKEAGSSGSTLTLSEIAASRIRFEQPLNAMSSPDWEPGTPFGRIPVGEAVLSGFGGNLLMRYGLSLDKVRTETTREGAALSRTRTRVDGLRLAPSLRSVEALGLRMVLQAMGLNEVRVGFDCSFVDDRTLQEVKVEECRLTGAGLVEVTLDARAIDADEAFWRAIDEGDPFALLGSNAAFASAKLVLADKSLLQRSLQAKAMLGGQSLAAERAGLAAEIRRYQPPGVLITQDMTRLLDTLARFVEQGGTLSLDANPQPPLGLEKIDYLLKPGADLVSALGLVATLSR